MCLVCTGERFKYLGNIDKSMTDTIMPIAPKVEYRLEDADFLLITAIRDLTKAINRTNQKVL